MAVKTYIFPEIQDFMKIGTGNLRFGEQQAATYKLPVIYEAYAKGSTASPTSITAVKIKTDKTEISRTSLATDLIIYDAATDQYLTDQSKLLASLLDNCIYFIEFENGFNLYKTDAFLVQEMNLPITWDMTVITFDSTLITFDETILNI